MINIVPVWKMGYLGTGIRIRVNDNGLASDHPDIAENFDLEGSCNQDDKEAFFYRPRQPVSENTHGTDCAFLAAGRADNGVCGNGMAPQATLSACNGLSEDYTFLSTKIEHMDISSNSFGTDACDLERGRTKSRRNLLECPFTYVPDDDFTVSPCNVCDFAGSSASTLTEMTPADVSDDCEQAIGKYCDDYYEHHPMACLEFLDFYLSYGQCQFNTLSTIQREALTQAITEGRNGKGIIFVWAAGNAYAYGEDTNFEGFLNTRFTISVGAVGKDGKHTSYSTPGAAMVVAAPGGDSENLTNFLTANAEGGCHDAGIGTSFSTPIVAGVLALVLEANPNLSWRDVQGILATTSRRVTDDPADNTLVTNAAGITHSNFYGFGVVDAKAAVEAAKTWALYGPEQMLQGRSGVVNLEIADDANQTLTSTIRIVFPGTSSASTETLTSEGFVGDTFDNTNASRSEDGSTTRQDQTEEVFYITESVYVYVDLAHFSRGDLAIVLTSPHGTKSVLSPGKRPETTQLTSDNEEEYWKFMTVRSWGEMAQGDWTLEITDLLAGDVDTCVDIAWSIVDQGTKLECDYFQFEGYCVDGSVDEVELEYYNSAYLRSILDTDGLSFVDACCACGGGQTRTSNGNVFVDQLIQWRLVIYGRLVDGNGSPVYTNNDGGAASPAGESSVSRGSGDFVSTPSLLWILAVTSIYLCLAVVT
jgi:kexin